MAESPMRTEYLPCLQTPLQSDEEVQVAERVRVQELLRYFQPSYPAADGVTKPRVASDTALTAFAQLAALKLDCQRSFISIVDHEHQFIIAEATRSMSLLSDDVRDGDDDALFTGAMVLDLVWGMCASTIKVFTATDGRYDVLTKYLKTDKESFVICDMSQVEEYKHRPYVTGWPHMRYYAEVPINSPNGLCIGSICVVDDKPRDGLSDRNLARLQEIASTIMDHLDLVMSRIQRKRAQQMIEGLGLFAQARRVGSVSDGGDSSKAEESMRILTLQDPLSDGSVQKLASPGHESPSIEPSELMSDYFEEKSLSSSSSAAIPAAGDIQKPNDATDPVSVPPVVRPYNSEAEQKLRIESTEELRSGHPINGVPPHLTADLATKPSDREWTTSVGLQHTLEHAVNIICNAVDLDGAIFYDQRHIDTSGVFTEAKKQHTQGGSRQKYQSGRELPAAESGQIARILSASSNDLSRPHITESLLNSTIERFPQGGILRFDSDGNFLGHIEFGLSHSSASGFASPYGEVLPERSDAGAEFFEDAQKLNKGVNSRSIVLFPLWAPTGGRLFAYAVCFTSQSTRVFQREDLAYIASFSNLLTAELSRLEILSADQAKAAFISSISHELRSPLHGILASAELLQETLTDIVSKDIVDTIASCGSTLLDTFDNLLAFAKINNFTTSRNQGQVRSSSSLSAAGREGLPGNPKSLTLDIDLSHIVEEVMDSSIAGHHFRTNIGNEHNGSVHEKERSDPEQTPITVICDIQPVDWVITSQPGVWKRIVMNLLGNSLKYTSIGYIHVRLSRREMTLPVSGDKESYVVLSVEDTGKGISKEFLTNHLYKPFHQEDSMQAGTGLGLSIVRQLVDSIDGSVEVESEVDQGTLVTVTAKMMLPEGTSQMPLPKPGSQLATELSGATVGFVGFNVLPDLHEQPSGILNSHIRCSHVLQSSLMSAIEGYGLRATTALSLKSEGVDIFITTEYMWQASKRQSSDRDTPVIVLCDSPSLKYRKTPSDGAAVAYLSQPFGPTRLLKALKYCLKFGSNSTGVEISNGGVTPKLVPSQPKPDDARVQKDAMSVAETVVNINNAPSPIMMEVARRPRALLVEDNKINLKILVTFMRKLQCPYETASDGQEAINAYKMANGAFDVVFMDVQMPNKDGLAASAEIREFEQQQSLSRTLIVAITGLASLEAQEKAAECGVDSMLTKPVPLKTLKAILAERFPDRDMVV